MNSVSVIFIKCTMVSGHYVPRYHGIVMYVVYSVKRVGNKNACMTKLHWIYIKLRDKLLKLNQHLLLYYNSNT